MPTDRPSLPRRALRQVAVAGGPWAVSGLVLFAVFGRWAAGLVWVGVICAAALLQPTWDFAEKQAKGPEVPQTRRSRMVVIAMSIPFWIWAVPFPLLVFAQAGMPLHGVVTDYTDDHPDVEKRFLYVYAAAVGVFTAGILLAMLVVLWATLRDRVRRTSSSSPRSRAGRASVRRRP